MPSSPLAAHRDGQLRALPARHARQDRRLPRHAAHRRVQDGAEPAHREDLHAGAPRDGRSRSTGHLRAAGRRRSPRAARRARPRSARSSTTGRSCRRTRVRAGPGRRRGLRGPAGRQGQGAGRAGEANRRRRVRPRQPSRRSASGAGRASRSSTPSGTIVSGRSGYDPLNGPVLGSDTLVEYIRKVRERSPTSAASCCASTARAARRSPPTCIWRELMLMRDAKPQKPLVVSMSDLAASGGYYIAMAAPQIVARAGDADRLDRDLRRQDRDRRRLREARREHRGRRARARHADMNSPTAPVQRRRSARSWPSSCRRSTTSSSRRSPRRGT